jgi:hypothetical protein
LSDLSPALKEAYARSATSTRHLVGLHLTLPGSDLYLVNYDNDIEGLGDGQRYVGVAMDISEPESGTDPDDKVSVRIDGTSGEIQYLINSAIGLGGNIPCSMKPFAFNLSTETVIGVIGTYEFLLLKATYNDQAVQIELGHISPTNQAFPGIKYDPLNSPELFR